MLEEIVAGIAINLITQISKKYNVRQTHVIALLCLIIGIAYVIIENNNPDVIQRAGLFIAKAFAVSQGVYMSIDSLEKQHKSK